MTRSLTDDLGTVLDLPDAPARVVSLVPSLTEAVAATAPGLLVGATDWCTHPTDLDVTRVRGTKNPDLAAVRALSPDLVVANKEENRELDVRRLRESGVAVWVTDIETVPQALASMRRLLTGPLALGAPTWLDEADELWGGPPPPVRDRVAVPIWRDPWMVVGPRTYTTDLLRRMGHDNPFAHGTARYPAVEITQVDADGVDEVWLPDEPYVFTAQDGPEAFTRTPTRLVSGRLLTWYGPAMVQAHHELR
ncbi:helical backbone metal receptor [Janibacter melonis]|uniref:helical backbone metal receptor n=1 Tax=Janibacter melonis TaxID=262209 RepID=UPI001E60152B|nr:helical backbone metal receptor [Janibacter melonis]MCB5992386.1 helical backbone metal receptor [Janibacter melonis]